ncbi:MAG TPA: NUDIX domain-containing protein [Vicinamibacterales bacterium]|nr:NUDIX domain-containing protein [Vicinamibacterales bacterium]
MPALDPLDLVRAFYQALNRGDLDAVVALYHPDCIVEHVFTDDGAVYEGREIVAGLWAAELARFRGALAGGRRFDVTRVAGMETAWGWVRADWSAATSDASAAAGEPVETIGYSYFWIEDGLIRRHRSVARRAPTTPAQARTRPHATKQYPLQPVVGVGAVVMNDHRQVLLVKRRHEPLAGQWSLPGGALELGETLEAAAAREILEETGLVVDVGPVVEVFDRILVDEAGQVQFHFVLVDYLCTVAGGALQAGSDVDDAQFADPNDLGALHVAAKARDVVARALRMKDEGC